MSAKLDRRDFLKLVAASTGGLVLAIYLDGCAPSATPQPATALPTAPAATATATAEAVEPWAPSIYLKLDDKGILTVMAFRSEMGQGIRTALAMLAADELDVEWANVRIEQAEANSRYGDQMTGGSVSISGSAGVVRKAGAVARQMLVSAAAQSWGVEAAQCKTAKGQVMHPDGKQQLAYGSLVDAAAKLGIPQGLIKLKEKAQFNLIGT